MLAVRLATMDDAEVIARQTSAVQQLHTNALPDIFRPASAELFADTKLAALLRDPNSIVAVAEMNGRIVGHIYGEIARRAENAFNCPQAHMYIHQIGVEDGAHRQGVGRALVAFVRDRTLDLGLTEMRVDHWAFNARAASFFEACGFRPMKIVMRQTLADDGSR
jgi:GNAT superfamily N-acetyltransferase